MHSKWKHLRDLLFSIRISLCKRLLIILLKHPHLIFGTVKATVEATYESEVRFQQSHLRDNIANGFKHAAWNALIAYYCQFYFKSPDAALRWAKLITDMHEECFPNQPTEKKMDLDNNAIGREIYLKLYQENHQKPNKKILLNMIEKQDLIVLS